MTYLGYSHNQLNLGYYAKAVSMTPSDADLARCLLGAAFAMLLIIVAGWLAGWKRQDEPVESWGKWDGDDDE